MRLCSTSLQLKARTASCVATASAMALPRLRTGRPHVTRHIARGKGDDTDEEDIDQVLPASLKLAASSLGKPPTNDGSVAVFMYKVRLAWHIFFPNKPKELTPTDEVKKRLRMVLVADRCGMSPANLADMRKTIVRALEDYVDIESEEAIEVIISNEEGVGTVYSVNIPVRKVKADVRFADVMAEAADGVSLEWSPDSYDADPSKRFPMGT